VVLQVRDFLLSKLYQLRKPKTNISIIQQNALLKYKYFVRFLAEHGPDVYQEVRRCGGFGAPSPSMHSLRCVRVMVLNMRFC
jgi:hypothetical protein